MKCPRCQTELPDTAKFCLECGQAFTWGNQHPESHSHPEAERKRVTALFSDLSGYTAITEKLDPEEVRQITGRIFDGIKGIVGKYEGFIEKFAGDGVLILFGVPRAHEDDALRAIRAAQEIHHLVNGLSPQYEMKIGRSLTMHSGINTGLVVSGEVDPQKGTHSVTGDTINVASRLSDLAEAGEILVGPDTYKTTGPYFRFESLKPARVKGKSDLIQIYKLISKKPLKPQLGANRQVSSEMVGRDPELAKLELQIMKAVNGEGSVINVVGEAGIGKSRLIAELKQRDVMKGVALLEGRAMSIGKNLSFHPIIDLIKQWAGIAEDDAESASFRKLEAAIRRIHPQETDEVLPFLATLMGTKLTGRHAQRVEGIEGEALEKLIMKNVKELLIRATDLQPTIIVMEDLHWADRSSLELLDSLFRIAEKHPLVFINVFRPGYLEAEDMKLDFIGQKASFILEIGIRPLEKNESEVLIKNMLKIRGMPHSISEQIVERAGGNPFFIEEVVRSFIDDGVVVLAENGFEVTEKIHSVVIPPTINDVLMARIDRLEEQTRELIKIASVIGRSFFDRILKEIAASIEGIDDRLSYLKDAQLIRDRVRMEELEYLFKHALAQEAAYESILIQQRRELHQKVAQSIENIFQHRLHEFYGTLAFHYSKADEVEKTEEYMTKAGEEALRSSASSEALYYFQEALQLYQTKYGDNADPDKLVIFEKNIAMAFANKGQWVDAVKYFTKVLQRLGMPIPKNGPAGVLIAIRDVLALLKAIYWRLPKSARAPSDQEKEIFEIYYKMGQALLYVDNAKHFLCAFEMFRQTLKFDLLQIPRLSIYWTGISCSIEVSRLSSGLSTRLLETSNRYRIVGDIGNLINNVGMSNVIYHFQGNWDKLTYIDDNLLLDSLKFGDFFHSSFGLWFYGWVKLEQGEFDHIENIIGHLFDMGETYNYDQAISNARTLRVNFLLKLGNSPEAFSEAEKGIFYMREKGNELEEMIFLGLKAEAQQLLGDTKGAHDSISQALELHDKQSLFIIAVFLAPYLTARFSLEIEQLKQAILFKNKFDDAKIRSQANYAGKAAIKNSRKYAPYRTKILRLMGNYHWLIGKQGKAFKWWERAIHEGSRLGARPDLSRTYLEVGRWLLEPDSKFRELNGIDAKGYLEKARILFEEMGLERDLDDLDRLTADHGL